MRAGKGQVEQQHERNTQGAGSQAGREAEQRGRGRRTRKGRGKGRQTHTATDTQTHRHTQPQTHRHTDTQAHRHTGTQTHRHTDTQTHTQTHRHTDAQTPSHTLTLSLCDAPSVSAALRQQTLHYACAHHRRCVADLSLQLSAEDWAAARVNEVRVSAHV